MSFRLRIFLLVLVVAGTAIGATAWLTLSLASREVARADQSRERHQAEIAEKIHMFGVLNGQWSGIDVVVAGLSATTGLHIRVETVDGEPLTDSDQLEGREVGPVQLLPAAVDPVPRLDQQTLQAARRIDAQGGPKKIGAVERKLLGMPAAVAPRPFLPRNLLDGLPGGIEPTFRAFYQLVQYRAALFAARCLGDNSASRAALATDLPPYLDGERLTDSRACVDDTVGRVLDDISWLDAAWAQIADCQPFYEGYADCLSVGFTQAASTTTATPVQIFFGARQGAGLDGLRQPAMIGLAALLLAAAIGTAWIARRVSRPVRLLTGASLQLAAGRLDVRVPARGQDELARLSGAFNAMAEALQRSEERQRRLVADVAHELRTPLSNLRGYLEGLADGVIEPSPELFASLHEETLLQRRILDDLQVLALAESGELGYDPVPLDLSELTETAATVHRAVAQSAGVDVVVDAPDPVEVCADPDRMRQVLGNLMSNAIRYTDAGGRVELRVSRDGPDAILTVRDTGVGMNAEEVSRVFDRFWRADPARQRATGGSGLGLTIVRRIVADQGGEVTASSEPGLGTTFTVRLPAVTRISRILDD